MKVDFVYPPAVCLDSPKWAGKTQTNSAVRKQKRRPTGRCWVVNKGQRHKASETPTSFPQLHL